MKVNVHISMEETKKQLIISYTLHHKYFNWFEKYETDFYSWIPNSDSLTFNFKIDIDDYGKELVNKIVFENPVRLIFSVALGTFPHVSGLSIFIKSSHKLKQIYQSFNSKNNQQLDSIFSNSPTELTMLIKLLIKNLWGKHSPGINEPLGAIVASEFSMQSEIRFIWSYWAIEWLVNSKDKREMFNFPFCGKAGIKFKNKLKKDMKEVLRSLGEKYEENQEINQHYSTDMKIMKETLNNVIFHNTLKQKLSNFKKLIDELSKFQKEWYNTLPTTPKTILEQFITINLNSVEKLLFDKFREYRNSLNHKGLYREVDKENNYKFLKYSMDVLIFFLIFYLNPNLDKHLNGIEKYSSYSVPEEEMKIVDEAYNIDFFQASSCTLHFSQFEVNSKENRSIKFELTFLYIKEDIVTFKPPNWLFLSNVAEAEEFKDSTINTRLQFAKQSHQLILIDKEGYIHKAEVLIKCQNFDIDIPNDTIENKISLKILEIYRDKDYKELF